MGSEEGFNVADKALRYLLLGSTWLSDIRSGMAPGNQSSVERWQLGAAKDTLPHSSNGSVSIGGQLRVICQLFGV